MKIIKISLLLVFLLFFVISTKPAYLPLYLKEKPCLIFNFLREQSDQTHLETAPIRLFFSKHKTLAAPTSSNSESANAISISGCNITIPYSNDYVMTKSAIIATQSIILRLAAKYLLIPNILKCFNINLTDTDGRNTSLVKLISQSSQQQSVPIVTCYDVTGYILKITEYLIWLTCIRKPDNNMQIKSFAQTMIAQIVFNTFLNILVLLQPELMLAKESVIFVPKSSGLSMSYVLLTVLFTKISDFKNYIKEKITGEKTTISPENYQRIKWSNVNILKEVFGLCAEATLDSRSKRSFSKVFNFFFMDLRYRSLSSS